MASGTQLRIAGVLLVGVTVVLSGEVLWAWRNAPYDRWGWVVALIWLRLAGAAIPRHGAMPVAKVLAVSLGVELVGFVGHLNVASHLAAVAAWVPGWWPRIAVAVAGLAWVPALGWVSAKAGFPGGDLPLRLIVSGVGVVGWPGPGTRTDEEGAR
ncbi:MAG: hypothetical protein J6386_11635 [Candidatus Synoicihabitans palmerolidicus]|nr:hypothetical protein [Candidatus Synoicihabitans palmerolidicus]